MNLYIVKTVEGSQKKVHATPSNLVEKIKEMFKLQGRDIIIQEFDKEFDEYFDVEEEDVEHLQDRSKLMVIAKEVTDDKLMDSYDPNKMPTLMRKRFSETPMAETIMGPLGESTPSVKRSRDEPSNGSSAWSDLSDDNITLDITPIMAIDTSPILASETTPLLSSETTPLISSETPLLSSETTPLLSSETTPDLPSETPEFASKTTIKKAATKSTTNVSSNDSKVPWPSVFPIRDDLLSLSVKRRLAEKQVPKKTERSQVFTIIYEEAVKYVQGYFPDNKQYTQMVEALLLKYPHLRGEASFIDSNTAWHSKLQNFFRNTRKRGDRKIVQVERRINIHNEKRARSKSAALQEYVSENVWGVKNFQPMPCAGEDDFSVRGHMDILESQQALMPSARNDIVIMKAMDKTFPHRRNFILESMRKIMEIKVEYNLLFTYKQISAEFTRLTENDLVTTFNTGVSTYAAQLANLKPYKKEHTILVDIRNRLLSARLESRREYFKQCCAVVVVPQHLNENVEDFFFKEGESNSYPQIRLDKELSSDVRSLDIIIEGESICSCSELLTAYALMLATYYVFNIAYPDKLASSLLFYQKGFMGIHDNSKNPKVSRLFTTILS